MAQLETNRLFKVYYGPRENVIHTGIEAKTAEEAIRKSSYIGNDIVSKVTSEPIYTAGLGLETDEVAKSEDSVFKITIRGTEEAAVERLKMAIALAIGGMAVDSPSDKGCALLYFINNAGLTINAM